MKKSVIALFFAVSFSAAQASTVNIDGISVFTEQQINLIAGKARSIDEAAKILGIEYKKAGYMYVDIAVDVHNNVIRVVERKQVGSGKYGSYFNSEKPMTNSDLQLRLQRLTPELQANNEKVAVNVHKTKNDVEVKTLEKKTNKSNVSSALIFSNLGQRYSGENVGSAYVHVTPGSGQVIEATVSHAFNSKDSEGGDFNAGVLSWKKYSYWGESTIRGSIVDYKTGGEYLDYGLSGRVLTLNLEQAYLLFPHNKVFFGYGVNKEKKYFDLVNAYDQMTNYFFNAGIRGEYTQFNYDATFTRGFKDKYNFQNYDLLGVRATHFNILNIESEWHQDLDFGAVLSIKSGAQFTLGGDKTPVFTQLYAGGLDRGRAYNTGFVSVENGFFGRVQLTSKQNEFGKVKTRFYAGIDGLRGETSTNENVGAYSAYLGAKSNIDRVNIDLGVAKKIGNEMQKSTDEYKVYLTTSAGF